MLIDRAGDRVRLLQRHPRNRRQQRVELGRRGAVALDAAVALLEHQAGREHQRALGQIPGRQVAAQDHHALGVQRPAQLGLSLIHI